MKRSLIASGAIAHPEPNTWVERPYFAYGSNLDLDQMQRRCASAKPLGRAVAEGHELAFVGYSLSWRGSVATLLPSPGSQVEGILYRLTHRDRATLDSAEGHPNWYVRLPLRVRSSTGRFVGAETYLLIGEPEGEPSEGYLVRIWNAYRRWGFDLDPLRAAIHSARRSSRWGA